MNTPYPPILDQFVVVLVEPQLAINVGTVVRAMKNMGLTHLRLVRPAPMDLDRTQIAAHRTAELVDAIETFETLDAALADCHRVVGLSARSRTRDWPEVSPRERAPGLVAMAHQQARLALVFGREQHGLTNEELERCDELMTIPTRADYASLNLAQAVLLTAYELFLGAAELEVDDVPQGAGQVAPAAARARVVAQMRHTLAAIGFFKSQTDAGVMHTLRRLLARARLDGQEAQLLTGIFVEVLKFAELVRRGIIPDGLPPAAVGVVPDEELAAVERED